VIVSPKHLALMRHAKSSWGDPDIADHDRPLNARGRQAAALVGRHLRQAARPDLVLCSSAARARQTLELLELTDASDVLIEDQLYGATPAGLLSRLRMLPNSAGSVLVIGHNPGIEDFTRTLDRDRLASVQKFPTAAVALLHLPIPTWRDLDSGAGRLDEFVTPRDLG
jgi:phosphohistidine phosphatase